MKKDKAEEILKNKNLSVTELRKSILNFFIKSKKPITAGVLKKDKKLGQITESSIYRNLNKLVEANIIQEVPGSGDFQVYELISTGHHHHHHITCNSCKKVQCLNICGLEKKMTAMAETVNFKLVGHSVELIGICEECA